MMLLLVGYYVRLNGVDFLVLCTSRFLCLFFRGGCCCSSGSLSMGLIIIIIVRPVMRMHMGVIGITSVSYYRYRVSCRVGYFIISSNFINLFLSNYSVLVLKIWSESIIIIKKVKLSFGYALKFMIFYRLFVWTGYHSLCFHLWVSYVFLISL